MINLKLYSRQGCHLCEDMLDALMQFRESLGYKIIVFDVDEDEALYSLYNTLVPIVFIDNKEVFRYHFEFATLTRALE